jgi:hypothetical protein
MSLSKPLSVGDLVHLKELDGETEIYKITGLKNGRILIQQQYYEGFLNGHEEELVLHVMQNPDGSSHQEWRLLGSESPVEVIFKIDMSIRSKIEKETDIKVDWDIPHTLIQLVIMNYQPRGRNGIYGGEADRIKYELAEDSPNWNWKYLSANRNITLNDILNYPSLDWDFRGLSENPNITIEFILANLEDRRTLRCGPEHHWNWTDLTANPAITLKIILAHPSLPWIQAEYSSNPNVTIRDVLDHPEIEWNFSELSENPGIAMDDIESNLDLPWEFEWVSDNPNLTPSYLLEHLDRDEWNWYSLSRHPNMTFTFILEHLDFPWTYQGMSENPNITLQLVLDSLLPNNKWSLIDEDGKELLPTKSSFKNNWDWNQLSIHMNVTADEVLANPDLPWADNRLGENSNILFYDFVSKLRIFTYSSPSKNRSINVEDIHAHPEINWNYSELSINKFDRKRLVKSANKR